MSVELWNQVWASDFGDPLPQPVVLSLAGRANAEGNCWPSTAYVVGRSICSERSVKRATEALQKAGHLSGTRRGRAASTYHLHQTGEL